MNDPRPGSADLTSESLTGGAIRLAVADDSSPSATFASGDRDPLDRIAEEFVERCRRGETPSVAEYEGRFPDRAEQVRKLLGAVAMMEQLRRGSRQARFMPERIGEFRVLRELGRGGMGVVYEAVQESLWRHVAVKAIHHTQLDMKRLQRFQREAQAVAQLHHTNIVPIFGVGEHDGVPYYAMQYIKGRGLDALLEAWRGGDAPPRDEHWQWAARFAAQTAEALDYAHGQGVLHRDIKPANLLVDEHNAIWVTDFGLAKMVGHDELTASGDVIGTLRYLAPESLRGISEGRSDVYSLGLTLYEMLTLNAPFGDLTPSELLHQVSEGQPVRPRLVDPSIPRDLETIVLKATARDLRARYATAGALADDLHSFLADRPIRARRATFMEQAWRWSRRNRGTAALTAGVAASLLLAAVAGWTSYVMSYQASLTEKNLRVQADSNRRRAEQNMTDVTKLFLSLFASLVPEEAAGNEQETIPTSQLLHAMNSDPATTRMFADPLDQPEGGPGPGPRRGGMFGGRFDGPPSGKGPGRLARPGQDRARGETGSPDRIGGGPPPPPNGVFGRGGPDSGRGLGKMESWTSRVELLKSVMSTHDQLARSLGIKGNPELQTEVGWVYFKIGALTERLGDRAEADRQFDEALKIFDELSLHYPAKPIYFHRFFSLCSAINPWQTDPAMRSAVEGRLKRMETLLGRLLQALPHDVGYIRARMHLLAKLGLIRYQQQRPDVEGSFREARQLADQLIDRLPEEGYPHSDRSDVLEAHAMVLEDQGKVEAARRLLDAALEDLEWVAYDGLRSEALASRMESIADDFERLGLPDRSGQVQKRADEIDPRVVNDNRIRTSRPFGPRRGDPGPTYDDSPLF